jgi:hypothetical protein
MIKKFEFKKKLSDFVIVSLLKHGSRFLSSVTLYEYTSSIQGQNNSTTITENLIESLFTAIPSPLQTSSIKIGKVKRELKNPNTYFVYRYPYEAFCSAIVQFASITPLDDNKKLDTTKENINNLMANNGHFCFHFWRDVLDMVRQTNCEGIRFIDLDDLSDFLVLETLEYNTWNKGNETNNRLKVLREIGIGSKEELIDICRIKSPAVWEKFQEQIQLDTNALNTLLEKWKWQNPNVEMIEEVKVKSSKKKINGK